MRAAEVALVVFARAVVPGRVKTRLAACIGDQAAADVYRRLVERTFRTVAAWASAAPGRAVTLALATDADGEVGDLPAVPDGWSQAPQGAGDLGQRMEAALAQAAAGRIGAMVVGTDCPGMTPGDLAAGEAALRAGRDAVLGPALDGGYWLLGLRRTEAALFAGVPWGSARVAEETRARLAALGWCWEELALRADVDRPEDLPLLDVP